MGRQKNLTHIVQEVASHFTDRIIIVYCSSSSDSWRSSSR